jgi:Ca-activated chloride channel homolog
MIRLANPHALLLLLCIPPLVFLHRRRQYPAVIAYSTIQELAALPPSYLMRLRRALPVLRVVVLILCIVALARPQWGFEVTKVHNQGIAIDMVVDVSRSMEALERQRDGRQSNRLEIVKEALGAFVQGSHGLPGRHGDLIGMVTFARYADSVCPLTLDHDLLLALLDQVDIVTIPEENGTAIGEAMALGVERLRHSTAASRVMILLTDGSNNAGDTEPLQAAQIAKALGIKIYAIGAVTGGVPALPGQAGDRRQMFQTSPVLIDEQTLIQIASITGGRYFRATDSTGLQATYAEIDRLEKTATLAEHYQQYVERFPLPLLLSLALLLLEAVLVNTCLRTIP